MHMAHSIYDSESDVPSSSTEGYGYNSDDDFVTGGKRKRQFNTRGRGQAKGLAKAPPKPTYTAQLTISVNDGVNVTQKTSSAAERVDKKILDKIRKAMGLANHPGTREAEAKAAMRMAMKLMAAENITQADLIANETAEERSTRAGHSTVALKSAKGKAVRRQRWYSPAAGAACEAFDVQYYTESYKAHLNYVFYGLADNTVAAALSFEMLHNQIETWALERKGELKGQVAGNNYRLGVARRVLRDSEDENRKALKRAAEDEKRRVKEEEEVRAAEIARLDVPVVAEPEAKVKEGEEERNAEISAKVEDVPDEDAWHPLLDQADDSDDHHEQPLPDVDPEEDDDEMDMGADFDHRDEGALDFDLDALEEKVKTKTEQVDPFPLPTASPIRPPSPTVQPAVKIEPKDDLDALNADLDAGPKWVSTIQLRTFRDNAKTIAEDYIKGTGLKLKKGPKLKSIQYDKQAYNKGWDDGRKVDLKRRRIEDEARKECKSES